MTQGHDKTPNINDEHAIRLAKLLELKGLGVNPYPAQSKRTHTISEALAATTDEEVFIVGRVMTKRDMGKLMFCHIQDEFGKMQIAFKKDEIDVDLYKQFSKKIDIGDIVQIHGKRFQTHKGEESVLVLAWQLLAKSLLPLPDKFHGMQNEELRYRKRYLDFLCNPEQKEKILARSRVLRSMRNFLDNKGFVEVETPMLETVASGTMARPFETYINDYGMPVFLRIAGGELWLKRLMVGGFEKVYDMGRVFRNEGVDYSHNPEFTMLEYYWAYADVTDNILLHQEMIPCILQEAVGSLKIENEGHTLDFTPPYPVKTFRELVKKYSDIDINDFDDVGDLLAIIKEKGYAVEETTNRGKLLDSLYKQSARPKIIQPTFVTEYPVELKPLAKRTKDPRYAEMFQLVVKGCELSNSYTELNDPLDQRERFEEQARIKEGGEEEDVMLPDEDFVIAMEHGMPPSTGTGIGIDRFVALITGSHTVREVVAFPLVKPVGSSQEEE
ncbi:MAG: lysine--tRNA ligase [Candidatus Magasanikbacteria bacterium]|jgi:lysyl-tRNA synthetase, class II|nr:lysine--tRNA ligase [Candidatus Magasanikbacteria bacterium]MBT5262891.1 lysine--tRNA ligase [Candidatus Magasanikbacteria bacterium]MBT5820028.1 lysine--tRNA ligase [Candidatus Magasanikbacteria bacterium]MBT6294690.1 lysine--tRNA ligase [Candidatus Magasanikbacteria bacterium]